jgi:hypothetical protein
METAAPSLLPDDTLPARSVTGQRALRWSSAGLMAVTWLSAGIFGAYILSYYGLAAPLGRLSDWNKKLPDLYDAATPLATLGIGLHFIAGAALLLLGPLQFFARIRVRTPAVHRWVGRVYAGAALVAGVGGLAYIAGHGTIGGAPMSVGFGLYGALVALSAAQTLRYGYARRFDLHRAWAIRLYALAIGSWLYRMDYGFWLLFANGRGHTRHFTGRFDFVMDFFFYLPNLVVAELAIRARPRSMGAPARIGASVVVSIATAFVLLATYFFARYEWLPAIVRRA